MTGPAQIPARPTSTEEVPATPGWVEGIVEAAFATLPCSGPGVTILRNAYLDCLAGAPRTEDLDAGHDRCRQALLKALAAKEKLRPDILRAFETRLEAVEAEISARI
ncbi:MULTISPECIES: hypothetical protein [Nguyenibacter]|uniref:Uncharacterized protein n=1 Tax=Nguyenibacter vanlangensis TaxID=1216886 RepID=A0A7Y7IY10_9PROT|nr:MULTISPECIES: hypothetical protein [Nguyenibacter]NVN12133.1 hypothetical protein [Nguyenibacter vanlangensis]WRH86376.1 hypothetical protein QN315_09965 [Nguyenibacter sp. L1]